MKDTGGSNTDILTIREVLRVVLIAKNGLKRNPPLLGLVASFGKISSSLFGLTANDNMDRIRPGDSVQAFRQDSIFLKYADYCGDRRPPFGSTFVYGYFHTAE